jgi:hypothetical protein
VQRRSRRDLAAVLQLLARPASRWLTGRHVALWFLMHPVESGTSKTGENTPHLAQRSGGGGIRTHGPPCGGQRFSRPPRSTAPAPRLGPLSQRHAAAVCGRSRASPERSPRHCSPARRRGLTGNHGFTRARDRPVRPLRHPASAHCRSAIQPRSAGGAGLSPSAACSRCPARRTALRRSEPTRTPHASLVMLARPGQALARATNRAAAAA